MPQRAAILMVSRLEQARRMRLLQRVRHHIAARHLEELALEAGIGGHHHHGGALLDAIFPHPPLLDRIKTDSETAELHQRATLAGAKSDPTAAHEAAVRATSGD